MSDLLELCTFAGTATQIHVVGGGQALLTETGPFSHGASKTVTLWGAQLDGEPVHTLSDPEDLTPVAQNDDGQALRTLGAGVAAAP